MKTLMKIAPAFGALLLAFASPCMAADNTVGGTGAGEDVTTGTNNTVIGTEAGSSVTTGTDNTLLGYKSGYGVTGSYNVILGEDPSSAITSGSSNILIGNSLTGLTDSSSNQLNIGNVITGTGLGTPSTSDITIPGNLTVDGSCTGCGGGGIYSGGQLQRGGSTTLDYCPYKGNLKTTASQGNYTIPSGCLSATITSMYKGGTSGQSLSANTLYYIYLWDNSGTWVLDAETTGHTTNTTTGVEQENGDATKALVGMVYPQSGPVLTDSTSARLVATWDNRQPKSLSNPFTTNRTTTSGSFVEINSEIRGHFLTWGDSSFASFTSEWEESTINGVFFEIILDSTSTAYAATESTPAATNTIYSMTVASPFVASEGEHYVSFAGAVNGGTATWNDNSYLSWMGTI